MQKFLGFFKHDAVIRPIYFNTDLMTFRGTHAAGKLDVDCPTLVIH